MIIGFSHLTINSNNPRYNLMEYLQLGYELDFSALNISNSAHKKTLLKTHSPTHDIYYLKHAQLNSIELINHFSDNKDLAERLSLEDKHINISLPSSLLFDEVNFWKELGFKQNNNELTLTRLSKAWSVTLKIRESELNDSELQLDSLGATSLAFLVKKLNYYTDSPLFIDKIMTKAFELSVNNKLLNIIFLKSPSGIPVELIEIKR